MLFVAEIHDGIHFRDVTVANTVRKISNRLKNLLTSTNVAQRHTITEENDQAQLIDLSTHVARDLLQDV